MPDKKKSCVGSVIICCFIACLSMIAVSDCPLPDLSGNCIVDMSDLLIFADYWLSSELPVDPDLVARWRLDEFTGETAVEDINGYDGLLYGDPQWMPSEGYRQGALFFDGQDDYVEISGYKGISGGASRTCSAWIKTASVSREILTWGQEYDGGRWVIRVNEGGQLRAEVQGGNIIGSTLINENEWHHVTVVIVDDGNPDIAEAHLYVDGQLETISSFVDEPINSGSVEDVKIGAYLAAGGPRYFQGLIDDVRIYDRAFTPEDSLRLYQSGSAFYHNPDMNADNLVNIKDYASLSYEWHSEEPEIIINEFLASNDSDDPPVTEEGQILDGNGDSSDWIELYNQTDFPVDLADWSLSDDAGEPFQWRFPQNTIIQGRSFLLVFASGKKQDDFPDNYPYVDPQGYLHTNFKLSASGEYLALGRPGGTTEHAYDSVQNPSSGVFGFPEQEENISYGTIDAGEYYFSLPTPGNFNRESFLGFVDAPDFSHERGYYSSSFSLTLASETEDAVIQFTLNGTDPTLSNGNTYISPISVTVPTSGTSSLCVRAAAFKPGYETSVIKTKTYLLNADNTMKGLPAVCLSGSPTQTFFNPNGIMAIVGGAWGGDGVWYKVSSTDYNNVLGHGKDYERPVSMEYINAPLSVDFQEDCGIRVHGSAWMRPRYTLPTSGIWSGSSKYSFRLYFRSVYGDSFFRHPVLEQFPDVDKMDTIVLRAGHNDQTNPFVRDEMIRRLHYYMGHEASLGTFVNLFVNGSYKGYYNLCERIDEEFCQKYYDSKSEWDVVGWVQPENILEATDGDMTAFNAFINYAQTNDLADPVYYHEVVKQLDLEGFVDYLIVQCWGGNWDWPQNNWTATAERSTDRKWRFFVWDAEGCMDNDLYRDRFGTLNSESSYLSRLYRALKINEDFRMLFSDRLQKHFLESDSVMRKEFMDTLFWQLADEVDGVIPNINQYIPYTYIPGRESIFFDQCISQGLFTFKGPDIFLNGQKVDKTDSELENSLLAFQNASGQNGDIYFTLDGTDPRLSLLERVSEVTLVAENAPKRALIPTADIGTNWRSKTDFNDSLWNDGLPVDNSKTGGVGYEKDAVGNKAYISYDVDDEMYSHRTTAYIRIPFTVDPAEMVNWNYLTLSIRYDDGFVAYINGIEVCRQGFNGTPEWNSSASSSHENYDLVVIPINDYLTALQPGDNILAIHGLNIGTTSTDFIISPILQAGYSGSGVGISPAAQKYTTPISLQKSITVKARTLNGSTWSALRQANIIIGHVDEYLRISELLYHPNADPNDEFIELANVGAEPINLNGVSFTEGIDYTFGDVVLQPANYLLLVRNPSVFESKYGSGLPVAGQYEGALDDSGETLKLRNSAGNKIQTLDFEDDWYDITDGDGFSLTVVDPLYEKTALPQTNLAACWSFNEDDGTTVLDSTPGSHHGIIHNMQNTERVLGREYKALYFDGQDDYVEIPGYKGISGGASRSCSAWVKTSSVSGEILTWGQEYNGGRWVIRVHDGGQLRAEVQGGNIIGSTLINDNTWHHVTVVLANDGSPDILEAQLYVDGQLETISSFVDEPINTGLTEDVQIGVYFAANFPRYFQGSIDDVRIYDRALTPDEISLLAQDVSWGQKELWRPSAIRGGTPGRNETPLEQLPLPGAVVINEVLSHSHAGLPDWIELHNTTNENISIGGWFISDTFGLDADRKKYQIPAGVVLTPASPYYVIEESQFNNDSDPGCRIPFALSEGGETLYLQSALGEDLTGYFTKEEFDAAQTNVSFGRFQKSTGGWNFVPMSTQTKGTANAYPKVGPVIISEIMYNPGPVQGDQDYEYLELMNISSQPVRTAGFVSTYSSPTVHIEEWIPWKFSDGIAFEFPVDMELDAGQRILLVKNLVAFSAKYSGVPAGTVIMEWTGGSLDNGGEKLQLAMPGDQEFEQSRYYIREDRVNYDDEGEWTQPADGNGKSLTHLRPDQANNNYTNDPVNWTAADPTPGW